MKNFFQNKQTSVNILLTKTAMLLMLAMLFQMTFPILATANNQTPPPTEETLSTEENSQESDPSSSASIETGDAEAGTTIETETNTFKINSDATSTTPESAEDTSTATTTDTEPSQTDENSTSTPDVNNENIPEEETFISTTTSTTPESEDSTSNTDQLLPSTNIASTNTAQVGTNATSSANTGANSAMVTENFDIETGNAVSYVDLVNVVNTNIVDSDGLIEFIRGSLGYQNFDLRNTFEDIFSNFETAESTASCTTCGSLDQLINLTNQAIIENNITVAANTGDNTATGSTGEITTGNAYASANIANIVNTNVVDSNYLLLVFNNFNDLAGSLVLPNSDFFSSLLNNNGSGNTGLFNFSNTANINNNINTVANTGGNQATGTNNTIETGDSTATSYTSNTINQNFINTNSFSMLIRVQGDWSGNIFGLPEGMEWENTSEGIRLFYSTGGGTGSGIGSVNITNDATINNNVQVYALTGDNQIKGGNGKISTGRAYADTTAFNIANTNVLGSNWINLIFNIYGNWSGDIAFGQPDLWLGISTDTNTSNLRPSNEVSYTYTVFNNGDTVANNVVLESRFPNQAFSIVDRTTPTNGYTSWPLGSIAAGETKVFKVNTKISDDFGYRERLPLPLTARVWNDQPDANDLDNEDSLLLYVGKSRSNTNNFHKTFGAKFIMEKTADKDYALAGDTINYTVKFTNRGGPIFDSLLVDILTDENKNIISEQTWPLDKIPNGETITITYSIVLPKDIKDGVYTNTAQLLGMHGSNRKINRTPYESPVVEHKLNVGTGHGQLTSGFIESKAVSCTPYLTTYMKYGKVNDEAEVIKLQRFLQFNTTSEIFITGTFDRTTKLAVQAFQQQYADEILAPWGMTYSSGYVYYTTQKKINEIMCDSIVKFPLTTDQEKEISYFLNNPKPNLYNLNFGINTQSLPEDTHVSQTDTDITPALDSQIDDWIQLLKTPVTAFAR